MVEFTNASKERRPDVVTRDFLTAFCIGPAALQDVDEGAVVRAWRIRLVGNDVLLARSSRRITEVGAGVWETEVVLLTIADGIATREIDLAFTQNGDPIVCFERTDDNIWLYWFDPTLPGFTLTNFGAGRNPRVALDDPFDTTDSDVQLFFISDVDDAIAYRQQRDRYAVKYLTPFVDTDNVFLEDVFRGWDLRLHLLISVRNLVTGRYSLQARSSKLFPLWQFSNEELNAFGSVVAAESYLALISVDNVLEEMNAFGSIAAASVAVALTSYATQGEISFSPTVTGLSVVEVLITDDLVPEELDARGTIVSGSTIAIVISSDIFEQLDAYGTIVSASTVVV